MVTTTDPQNLGLEFIIRARSPHLAGDRLARAVRIEDRSDTLGRKKCERDRSRWLPIPAGAAAPAPAVEDGSADRCAAVEAAMASIGLDQLIPCLRQGLNLRGACEATGTVYSTAARKVAEMRDRLRNS